MATSSQCIGARRLFSSISRTSCCYFLPLLFILLYAYSKITWKFSSKLTLRRAARRRRFFVVKLSSSIPLSFSSTAEELFFFSTLLLLWSTSLFLCSTYFSFSLLHSTSLNNTSLYTRTTTTAAAAVILGNGVSSTGDVDSGSSRTRTPAVLHFSCAQNFATQTKQIANENDIHTDTPQKKKREGRKERDEVVLTLHTHTHTQHTHCNRSYPKNTKGSWQELRRWGKCRSLELQIVNRVYCNRCCFCVVSMLSHRFVN